MKKKKFNARKRHHRAPFSVEIIIQSGDILIKTRTKIYMKFSKLAVVLLAIGAAFSATGAVIENALLGLVAWSSSDDSIAFIRTDKEGNAYLVSTGKGGKVVVFATGDSNPDTPDGFSGSVELEFEADEVATVTVTGVLIDPATVIDWADAPPLEAITE
jgi:hypothetical protein